MSATAHEVRPAPQPKLFSPLCKQWMQRDAARMYARRPRDTDVWYLSPYEFWMYWEIAPARYVATADMLVEEQTDPRKYHCNLTNACTLKVEAREQKVLAPPGGHPKLVPGQDYRVNEKSENPWWIAYPEKEAMAKSQVTSVWLMENIKQHIMLLG